LSKFALRGALLLSLLLWAGLNSARAQGIRISPYLGLGGERDRAGTTSNSANACPTGQLFDGLVCEAGPTMGGLFGQFGVDFMFRPKLGINAEYTLHFSRVDFLPNDSLKMRPMFADLNAVYQPFGKRVAPVLEGGFGIAKISLYSTGTPITGVTNISSFTAGSDRNHFQLHGAAGLKFYLRGNVFFKPELDLHYATNLTNQFGRNLVIGYIIQAGYTFGGR
jgi:hypothetical protein